MGRGRISFVAASVVAAWAVAAGVAAAHDDLVAVSPADGQSVPTSPTQVELEFDGELASLGSQSLIRVTGTDGQVVSVGPTEVDGPYARQSLAEDLADGEYQVAYRVVSSDGHPVSGTTRFFVGPVPAASQTLSTTRASGANEPGIRIPGLAVAVGGTALAVTALLVLRRGRRNLESP